MKTSKIIYSLLIVLSLIVIASACTETPADTSNLPKKLYMVDLMDPNNIGFKWFPSSYNDYLPDTAIVRQIKESYAINPCKFYIYVKTSCKCTGTQVNFPSVVKTLTSAGLDTTKFEIYDSGHTNPYPQIIINVNPSCFLARNDSVYYSVTDTMDAYQNKEYKVEQVILMGLKK
jgi:hypothetical protein